MAVVTGGLGQPEEGALVAGGLGAAVSDPGAAWAFLAGSSGLSANLTATSPEPEPPTGGAPGMPPLRVIPPQPRPARVGVLAATLAGGSRVTAGIDFQIDQEVLVEALTQALMLDLV